MFRGVAQISNLLYRRIAFCGATRMRTAPGLWRGSQNAILRYSTARASRNQSCCDRETKGLLRLHKKSSRNGAISTDTDRLEICATREMPRGGTGQLVTLAPRAVLPVLHSSLCPNFRPGAVARLPLTAGALRRGTM